MAKCTKYALLTLPHECRLLKLKAPVLRLLRSMRVSRAHAHKGYEHLPAMSRRIQRELGDEAQLLHCTHGSVQWHLWLFRHPSFEVVAAKYQLICHWLHQLPLAMSTFDGDKLRQPKLARDLYAVARRLNGNG